MIQTAVTSSMMGQGAFPRGRAATKRAIPEGREVRKDQAEVAEKHRRRERAEAMKIHRAALLVAADKTRKQPAERVQPVELAPEREQGASAAAI
jgi:hypothetical protein